MSARHADVLAGLPGADMVRRGMADIARGDLSAEALVLGVARSRLRALGVDVPLEHGPADGAELALYARLQHDGVDDPYARYNAMLRELVSLLEALESRQARSDV